LKKALMIITGQLYVEHLHWI